jgi:F0F1-type ATP synthase assembly protein I
VTDANTPRDDVTTTESNSAHDRDAITGSFSRNADLISYIVSGLLIGLVLDWFLGTAPIMVIIWTILGIGVGYYRLWQHSSVLDDEGRERSHGA